MIINNYIYIVRLDTEKRKTQQHIPDHIESYIEYHYHILMQARARDRQ